MYPFHDINNAGPCQMAYAQWMAVQGKDKDPYDYPDLNMGRHVAQSVNAVLSALDRLNLIRPVHLWRALHVVVFIGTASIQRLTHAHVVRAERS